jgi:hypothetical protein
LGEAAALFFIGTLCPELPAAERWRTRGWQIVATEAQHQVRSDGVYFEQSLYYHVYALDLFLHTRVLATRNGMQVSPAFDVTLEKMLGVLLSVSQAGPPESFGDDDGGRVFNPLRNRTRHLADPLAVGAVLLKRSDLRQAVSLTEEAVWLFGAEAVSAFAEPSMVPQLQTSSFPVGGIYVMASAELFPQRLVIDAGPLGAGRAGHGHADALGVTLALDGRAWLVDSGTFGYVSPGNGRDYFRGTGAHNTVRVDGVDQAEPNGPFGWSSLPDVSAERWLPGLTFSLFEGCHNGYSRLPDPVLHRRLVFHLHGGFWLIRDVLVGSEEHGVESNWHFAPDLQVRQEGGAFIASPPPSGESLTQLRLAMVCVHGSPWISALEMAERSAVYGSKESAPVLRVSGRVRFPVEAAILILPLRGASHQVGNLSSLTVTDSRGYSAVCGYRYAEASVTHYMMFSRSPGEWALGHWVSDAKFIYCKVTEGSVTHFVLCAGSSTRFQEKVVLNSTHNVDRFEWLSQAGNVRIETSDDNARNSFSGNVFQNCEGRFDFPR